MYSMVCVDMISSMNVDYYLLLERNIDYKNYIGMGDISIGRVQTNRQF